MSRSPRPQRPRRERPAPIWADPAPGARRPRFTREQIGATALAIADAEGFAAVSMRRIAEALGAGTMTLYHYIRTKDDLTNLMDDALMAEVVLAVDVIPSEWRPAITMIARSSHAAFMRHPWALRDMVGNRIGPNILRHIEQSLTAVENAPCDEAGKLLILSVVDDFVFGHAVRNSEDFDHEATFEYVRNHIADGDFPRLRAAFGTGDQRKRWDEYTDLHQRSSSFERGLALLLDGIELQLQRGTLTSREGEPVGTAPPRPASAGAKRPQRDAPTWTQSAPRQPREIRGRRGRAR